MPYHQKLKLQEKLKHLSPEDLGQVVEFIGQKCPSAVLEEDNDNAQLVLDYLDAVTFEETME